MARSLRVEVIGDTARYQRSLAEAEGSTSRFGSGFKKLGLIAAAGGAAVGAVAFEIGKKTVEAALSAQEANDKLTQALKNQHIQLTATSPAFLKLEASARGLGFANADTRESLTKLIQAGKGVAGSTQEMGVAQDLARAKGISLGDATTALIKLQSGSTRAAKEFGIVLPPVTTAVQKLKDSHTDLTTAEGQHLLALARVQDKLATGQAYYDALTGKVKGQAQVFSDSAAGGIAKFHAALGNIEETIGAKLLPAFSQGIQGVDKFLNFLTGAGSASDKFKSALEAIGLSSAQSSAIVAKLGDTFKSTLDTIKAIIAGALPAISSLWAQWGGTIQAVVRVAFDYIVGTIRNVFTVIKGIFQVFHGLLTGDWSELWTGLKNIFGGISAQILNSLKTWLSGVAIAFGLVWKGVVALASAAFNGIVNAITGTVGRAVSAATALGHGIVNGIRSGLATIVGVVKGGLDRIWGVISNVASLAYRAALAIGAEIIHGIADGIAHAVGTAVAAVQHAGGAVLGAAKGFFHIGSPSKLMADEVGVPIMEGIAAGILAGMPKATDAAGKAANAITARLQAADIVAAVNTAGQTIGTAHALAIAQGVLAGSPTIVGQVKKALQDGIAAARQAVVDAKGAFTSAFNDLANAALAAFDAKWANWKPPALGKLAAMQLEDQIKQLTDGLGPAVQAAETALAAAFTTGNKAAIDAAQAALDQSLTDAQALIASNQAQLIADAQANLASAQAGGDQAAIDKAQAALDAAIATQTSTLAKAQQDQRALVEQNLTFRAAEEQKTHDAIIAKQREGLARQLAELRQTLLAHPAAWAKMGADVQRILAEYNIHLQNAGTAWADKFGAGIQAGIPAAVAAARALAAAVAAVLPSTHSPLKPAKTGPLNFHPYAMGKQWAAALGAGLADGKLSNIMGSMAGVPAAGAGTLAMAGVGGSGGTTINLHVYGSVSSENDLVETIYEGLQRRKARNVNLRL